jgi:hypothetical protein
MIIAQEKNFEKIALLSKPAQSNRVEATGMRYALSPWDPDIDRWINEGGSLENWVQNCTSQFRALESKP